MSMSIAITITVILFTLVFFFNQWAALKGPRDQITFHNLKLNGRVLGALLVILTILLCDTLEEPPLTLILELITSLG